MVKDTFCCQQYAVCVRNKKDECGKCAESYEQWKAEKQ